MLKQKNIRDKAHLAYIRKQPCMRCGSTPCDPAHIRKFTDGGMSLKPSDKFVVPLCRAHHTLQHNQGEVTFWGGEDGVRDAIKKALEFYEETR